MAQPRPYLPVMSWPFGIKTITITMCLIRVLFETLEDGESPEIGLSTPAVKADS